MRKFYKFFPLFFVLKACGSQDYGEPTAKAVEEGPYYWEEAVENSRLLSLSPVRGPSTKKKLASSGLKEVADCPTDTVCLRNPYMGSKQFTGLGAINSPLFDLKVSEEENVLTYKGPGLLFIEAEIVDLPGSLTIRSCADKTVVSAREITGTGTIRTNSPQCESVEGGDLILSALTIDRLSLDSSGSSGISGAPADSQSYPAKVNDGTSSPVKYSIQWGTPFKGKICATELACSWDGSDRPDVKYAENMNLLKRSKIVDLDDIAKFISKSSKEGYWYCWIENTEEGQFYKNLYLNWKITADFSHLKGGDAMVFLSGANGGDGGNAGDITIVALEHYLENFSSEGGVSGSAGQSFAQEPGKGAKLPNPKFDTEEVIWGGSAHCGKKDRDLNGNPTLYMSHHYSFGGRKSFSFTVGQDYESPVEGSKILGHELVKQDGNFYGADGIRTYTQATPSAGNHGEGSEPRLRIMSNFHEFGEAANDEIQGASLPKSIALELKDES